MLYQLVAIVDLNESEAQKVARYISGLKLSVHNVLKTSILVDGFRRLITKALLVEKQQMWSVSLLSTLYLACGS